MQGWDVPAFHYDVCQFLQSFDNVGLLMMPRGHAKSTLLGIYNAWRYYCDPSYRILHQGDQDDTAYKMSRDTLAVLERHPLTKGIKKQQGEVQMWWVKGSTDARNPSMQARGITSNVTSSRADEIQNDDVEVPRNIQTADAREKLRYRLGEQIHIIVPQGRKLFVGTPHTHNSLYEDVKARGATCLILKAFGKEHRIENGDHATLTFKPQYVYTGIGIGARLLEAGIDYTITPRGDVWEVMLLDRATIADFYADALWPERFTPAEMENRRKECRTLGEWDSQYQLHAKPVTEVRLNPERMKIYTDEPAYRTANGSVIMMLGDTPMVGAVLWVDPSSGKVGSDISAGALIFQDANGRRYWHRALDFKGDVATFAEDGKTITGGQVFQIADVVQKYGLGRVTIETNGIGGFMPAVLKAALKQRRLICGVSEEKATTQKNKRILEAFEPLLLSDMLHAHDSVMGVVEDQMRQFNPLTTSNEDDFIDSAAGGITAAPERIQSIPNQTSTMQDYKQPHNWHGRGGTYEVQVDY